jgi:hypothetical protein
MISSIYQNPARTVSRELIANALDAHAEAGCKDKPIDVYFPTAMSPTFVVRDYGVGMTHDFVMNLYSAMGYSTKEGTNEQTGMFGAGSKSPLAITDTFTVRCFDKPGFHGEPLLNSGGVDLNETGRVRLYSVTVAGDVPRIHHTFDTVAKTDSRASEGGVEVTVPLTRVTTQEFLINATEQYIVWFDKPINFHDYNIAERVQVRTVAPGVHLYRVEKEQNTSPYDYQFPSGVSIRQGAAVYPVRHHEHVLFKFKRELGEGVCFDVPIGTLDVTMSRENLQENYEALKEVSTNIRARLSYDSVEDTATALGLNLVTYADFFLAHAVYRFAQGNGISAIQTQDGIRMRMYEDRGHMYQVDYISTTATAVVTSNTNFEEGVVLSAARKKYPGGHITFIQTAKKNVQKICDHIRELGVGVFDIISVEDLLGVYNTTKKQTEPNYTYLSHESWAKTEKLVGPEILYVPSAGKALAILPQNSMASAASVNRLLNNARTVELLDQKDRVFKLSDREISQLEKKGFICVNVVERIKTDVKGKFDSTPILGRGGFFKSGCIWSDEMIKTLGDRFLDLFDSDPGFRLGTLKTFRRNSLTNPLLGDTNRYYAYERLDMDLGLGLTEQSDQIDSYVSEKYYPAYDFLRDFMRHKTRPIVEIFDMLIDHSVEEPEGLDDASRALEPILAEARTFFEHWVTQKESDLTVDAQAA